MEPTNKQEPAQNLVGRELFLSVDSDETIPERMLDIEEEEEGTRQEPAKE